MFIAYVVHRFWSFRMHWSVTMNHHGMLSATIYARDRPQGLTFKAPASGIWASHAGLLPCPLASVSF